MKNAIFLTTLLLFFLGCAQPQEIETRTVKNELGVSPQEHVGSFNYIFGYKACYDCSIGSGNIIIGDSIAIDYKLTDDNWLVDYNYHCLSPKQITELQKLSTYYKKLSRKDRIEKVRQIIPISTEGFVKDTSRKVEAHGYGSTVIEKKCKQRLDYSSGIYTTSDCGMVDMSTIISIGGLRQHKNRQGSITYPADYKRMPSGLYAEITYSEYKGWQKFSDKAEYENFVSAWKKFKRLY
jgi:hypothetical protein